MASLNKVQLIGRLGKDPEVRTTGSGKKVGSFSVATQDKKDAPTEWHNVVVWEKLAELAEQYLVKGSMVYLEGKIQTRSWDDKEGKRNYKTEIVAYQMQFLDTRKKTQQTEIFNPDTQDQTQYNGEEDLPF